VLRWHGKDIYIGRTGDPDNESKYNREILRLHQLWLVAMGLVLGAVLGPIGVLIACVMPESKRRAERHRVGYSYTANPSYPSELPGGQPTMADREDPLGFLRR
jgi:hypothetical protein